MEVPPLSPQEAKALLRLKLKGSASSFDVSSTTERLLDVLGYIPLAVTQAAAFIIRNPWTLQGYLAALEKDKQNLTEYLSQELQDPRRPRGFPNPVFRTWKLSFDHILAQEPKAAKLLSLIAMLDPQRIPEKLLRRLAEREVDFRMAIGTLDGFALISQEIRGETYAIHPLVQASVHYWLEQSSEKADYAGQALQLLAEEFPKVRGLSRSPSLCGWSGRESTRQGVLLPRGVRAGGVLPTTVFTATEGKGDTRWGSIGRGTTPHRADLQKPRVR